MNKYLYYQENDYELYKGKMQEVLSTFEEGSVDSIICDPPYELNFMGKGWDNSGVAFQKDTWEHCFKVLKEGGYLLAFGGSRTFHRIAVAIEDAGFEIRDCIMWLYGSGFPKSMNIGLAIDKKLGLQGQRGLGGISSYGGILGQRTATLYNSNVSTNGSYTEYKTELAKQWQGWGTALKPAYEPIIVARKPFKCSLVENIMQNGVGGLNIDECRIETNDDLNGGAYRGKDTRQKEDASSYYIKSPKLNGIEYQETIGRFPANVILTYDENDYEEVCGGMPNTKSTTTTTMPNLSDHDAETGIYSKLNAKRIEHLGGYNDEGSASRYFYCAKASKKDRDEGLELFEEVNGGSYQFRQDGSSDGQIPTRKNIHPTVKPVELMQYLVRLVTPKNGTILDCFMGSGSTGKAVMFENRERQANYKFIGVEMTEEYLPICQSRIDYAKNKYEYELIKEKQEQQEKGIVDIFDFMED